MAFPKFHGIALAANSWIENLHLERLASDPVPASAGRLWFNTTDKVIKFSTLDAGGAVVVKIISDRASVEQAITDIQTALANEVTRATNAENAIASDLAAEISRATAAEAQALVDAKAYTDGQISALVDGAPDLLNTLNELAAALQDNPDVINSLQTLIGNNAQAIADETARATAAENALQTELNTTQSGAGLSATGAYVAGGVYDVATNPTGHHYIGEATSLKDADAKLDTAVKAEETARIAGDNALNTAITNEATARADADTALDTRLTTVEGQVNGKIGDLASLDTDAKSNLVSAVNEVQSEVNAEAVARADADTAIRTDYNARKYSFTASASALVHTINHGLNTDMFLFTVMVEGGDGVYRNDVVPVEIVDANNIKVELSEARKIKVSMQSMANI